MKEFKVYPIGTRVEIQTGEIENITSVIIGYKVFNNGLSYVVSFWKDKVQQNVTVEEFEINATNKNKKEKIGFVDKTAC